MTSQDRQVVDRTCREVECSQCSTTIRFTTLHLTPPHPFMYCNRCSNVLLRDSDQATLIQALDGVQDHTTATLHYFEAMESTAPPCPCGGHFSIWAYVKCPSCDLELPYNRGVRDPQVRVQNRVVIVVDGAKVLGDGVQSSWICRCT